MLTRPATCMIVDDEPAAHYVLQNYISKVGGMRLVHQCYDAIEAINFLHHHPVDLMFLDIDMPEVSGLELLRTLKQPPRTILCTAYSEFALESYDYGVLDYLLKPVYFPRFLSAVERFFQQRRLSELPKTDTGPSVLNVRIDGEQVSIPCTALLYTRSFGNYVKLFTADRYYLAALTTNELENLLPLGRFLRIHKSHIIALDKITGYTKDTVRIGDVSMPVGITYRQKLAERMKTS